MRKFVPKNRNLKVGRKPQSALFRLRYPETLIESELFGHKKEPSPGRSRRTKESSRAAVHTTRFSWMRLVRCWPVQIKLLQVLQERAFSPVGSHAKNIPLSAPVGCSANHEFLAPETL